MKVLVVHPPRKMQGGAEEVIDRLLERLPGHGIYARYITSKKPHGRTRDLVALWHEVQETMRCYRFDLINAHNFPATMAAWPACRHIPTVWQCNEPAELFTSFMRRPIEAINRRIVERNIKHVIVSDDVNAVRAKWLYGNIDVRVIPYGVDCEYFARDDGHYSKNGFTMLQVGTITPWKNQMASLKALSVLRLDVPEARLVLAGYVADTAYMAALRLYMRHHGLEPYVEFTGHLSKQETRSRYHSADVLLQPARQQGGWLAPFEALSAGLPVVVWRSCLASQMITDDIGVLVDEHERVHETLGNIYANYDQHKEKAECGREWVFKNMTWDLYAQRVADYFREVAG